MNQFMIATALMLNLGVSAQSADYPVEGKAQEKKDAKMEDVKKAVGTGAPYAMFTPGKVWLDDRGKPIESHLGGLLYEKGTYYWYGMNFDTESIKPGTVRGQIFSWMENRGVTCYSSRDLYNWKFETVSLLPTRDDPKAPLQPTHDICRPKVIKCDKTGKYVMMAQLFSIDLAVNCIVVGIADTPSGPFAYHGLLNPPDGGRDITLFKDDDGKAYLIRGYEWVKASVLSDDYLSIASTHDLQGVKGESPAIFKHEGTYYCLTSQLTGYAPNANKYSIAKQVLGPWEPKGEFCKGPEANKTFGGQTTFVLPVAGVPGAFIFLADRWNSKTEYITEHRDATHIWLPITIDAATKTIQVPWRDTWDLSVFKQK